jgi:hypothetical protein
MATTRKPAGLTIEQVEIVGQFNDYACDYPELPFDEVAEKVLGPIPFPNTPNGKKFRAECEKAFDLERGV